MNTTLRVSTRNARFQQWQALLDNRSKRTRTGQFLVQGVRPITMAIDHGWPIRSLIHPVGRDLSAWAANLIGDPTLRAERVAMAPELMAELTDKEDTAELLAVAAEPADRLDRITVPPDFLGVVFDRPTSPGNIGAVIRSADAFGAHGVIIAGHAADPTIRALSGPAPDRCSRCRPCACPRPASCSTGWPTSAPRACPCGSWAPTRRGNSRLPNTISPVRRCS